MTNTPSTFSQESCNTVERNTSERGVTADARRQYFEKTERNLDTIISDDWSKEVQNMGKFGLDWSKMSIFDDSVLKSGFKMLQMFI